MSICRPKEPHIFQKAMICQEKVAFTGFDSLYSGSNSSPSYERACSLRSRAWALFCYASGTLSFSLFPPGSPPNPKWKHQSESATWSNSFVFLSPFIRCQWCIICSLCWQTASDRTPGHKVQMKSSVVYLLNQWRDSEFLFTTRKSNDALSIFGKVLLHVRKVNVNNCKNGFIELWKKSILEPSVNLDLLQNFTGSSPGSYSTTKTNFVEVGLLVFA